MYHVPVDSCQSKNTMSIQKSSGVKSVVSAATPEKWMWQEGMSEEWCCRVECLGNGCYKVAQGWLPSKVCQTRMSTSQAATLCDTFSWECAGLVQSVFSFLCFKIATSTSFPSSVWLLITVTVNAIFNRRWMFTTVENKKRSIWAWVSLARKQNLFPHHLWVTEPVHFPALGAEWALRGPAIAVKGLRQGTCMKWMRIQVSIVKLKLKQHWDGMTMISDKSSKGKSSSNRRARRMEHRLLAGNMPLCARHVPSGVSWLSTAWVFGHHGPWKKRGQRSKACYIAHFFQGKVCTFISGMPIVW